MKKLSTVLPTIVLWTAFIVTIGIAAWFFTGPQAEKATATGTIMYPELGLDHLLYWTYAVMAIGLVLLLCFAVAELGRMFKVNAKGTLVTIGSFAAFVILLVVCYFLSDSTEINKIVNGENVHYSEVTVKMIDMWLYSIYAMVALTVVLVAGFGAKKLIK